MTRAAIWDVDGTLVDTAELHFVAWQAACRELGRDFDRADFAATFGRRNPEIPPARLRPPVRPPQPGDTRPPLRRQPLRPRRGGPHRRSQGGRLPRRRPPPG